MNQPLRLVDSVEYPRRRENASSRETNLHETLRLLWRRRWLMVGVFVLVVAGALTVLSVMTPRYTAVAKIMIDPRQTRVVDMGDVVGELPANMESVLGEIEVITSSDLAGKVVDKTDLASRAEFNRAGFFTPAVQDEAAARQLVIENYLDALHARMAGRSRVINISFTSQDPALAAEVVNAAADLYLSGQIEARFEATERAQQWLTQRLVALSQEAEAKERTAAEFSEPDAARRATLEREAKVSRSLYETFLARAKETGEQAEMATSGLMPVDARLISRAAVPGLPSFPNRTLFMLLTLAGGIIFALTAAFAAERLENGFRSRDQVEAELKLPVLTMVPSLQSLGVKGFVPEQFVTLKPASAYAEALRMLRTALRQAGGQVFLFTSAVAGEGKTTAALSLARQAGEAGERVLVIDADIRRPRIHAATGATGPGLIDVLQGRIPLEKAIVAQGPKGRGVYILSAGTVSLEAAELLNGGAMKELLARLRGEYGVILIDSPPVLPVADARALAPLADRTVLVAKWNEARREVVGHAVHQLDEAGAKMAGVVLNQVDVKRHAEYGYSDSGCYYGQQRSYYQN